MLPRALTRTPPTSLPLRSSALAARNRSDRDVRLPPSRIVREGPPPDDLLLVVRGGRESLSDAILERATTDSWETYRFFGVSVFGVADDDLSRLSAREPAIRRRAEVRVARVGALRGGGFEVVATFGNPAHYSVVMAEASASMFQAVRSCFSPPQPNPGYEPDR